MSSSNGSGPKTEGTFSKRDSDIRFPEILLFSSDLAGKSWDNT